MYKIGKSNKFISCANPHKKRAKMHIQHMQKSIIFAKDVRQEVVQVIVQHDV